MAIPSPPVDPRSEDQVTTQTAGLVSAYSGWKAPVASLPSPESRPGSTGMDAGAALIRIFAGMAIQVITRANQVTDRNFLAFLNLIGVVPQPARAARAALTFTPANNAPAGASVLAGTLVGAETQDGDSGPVSFETTSDLTLTSAALAATFVRQPDGDYITDCSAPASRDENGFYSVFAGEGPADHDLYVAADSVLGRGAGTAVHVTLGFSSAEDVTTWNDLSTSEAVPLWSTPLYTTKPPAQPLVVWQYWNGSSWASIPSPTYPAGDASSWILAFAIPADMAATSVNGTTARWIRAKLRGWPAAPIPAILSVTAGTANPISALAPAPDVALFNGAPIDITKDFYPLGQQPAFNDACWLTSSAGFPAPGATVVATVTASAAMQFDTSDKPTIVWEAWDGSLWVEIGRSDRTESSAPDGAPAFTDGTLAFTSFGQPGALVPKAVTFTLPATAAPLTIGGVTGYWVRFRLAAGNYGTGITIVNNQVADNGWRPPILASIALEGTSTPQVAATCFSCDEGAYVDQSAPPVTGFVPFTRMTDTNDPDPLFYLGFDGSFGNSSVTLYLQVAPLALAETPVASQINEVTVSDPPSVIWEYSRTDDWAPLGPTDGTQGFAESGLLRFVGPIDHATATVFGQNLRWIRARLYAGSYDIQPRAGLVLTNTVFATHTTTIYNEALGTGDGTAGQRFTLAQAPVLAGQIIQVSAPGASWTTWHEVPNFYGSGPRSRCYMFNAATGEVRFGDGINGQAPPSGASIRAAFYQTGGGSIGNRPAGTIDQMKTATPYVASVTNEEPSSGGSDAETIDQVKDRGPTMLRNGGRAVAAQDFEDLAMEASPSLARVSALCPVFSPIDAANPNDKVPSAGHVLLVVVPYGTDPKPSPGAGLLAQIGAYLRARAAPAVKLQLSGPEWLAATVTYLSVVPTSSDGADTLRATIARAITAFFHPLTGGPNGAGWQIGQIPHSSDVYTLVASIPGVSAVSSLTMALVPDNVHVAVTEYSAGPSVGALLVYAGPVGEIDILAPAAEGG